MSDSKDTKAADDPTGRDRLTWNVLASWLSMAVNIVLGFVMPRLVDEQLGQTSLGIWDFSWALVNYITLVNLGVGSNASRYVAAFAVNRDVGQLQRIVSSAHVVQLAIGSAVAFTATCVALSVDRWLPAEMTAQNVDAKWVILLLGLSLAVEMYFDAWRGVLTGIHRWDLHNAINTLHSVLTAISMLTALLAGFGLIGMASMYFVSTVITEWLRWRIARRYCPEARIHIPLANRADIRLVTLFGLKNVIAMAGPLVVQQTLSVLITLRLGPALLAIFSRPIALTRQVEALVFKFAFVLMPMAGSMQAQNDPAALRRFSIDMCEVGWALAIPGGLLLMLLGPDIIELWMGADYVSKEMIIALAGGGMLAAANRPAYRILFGLDRHGTASILSLVVYGIVLIVGIPLMLSDQANLLTAAILYVAGDVLFSFFLVPQQLAKVIGVPTMALIWQSARRPLAVGIVSGASVLLFLQGRTGNLVLDLMIAASIHGVVTGALYWRYVFPPSLKANIVSMLMAVRRRFA